MSNANAVRCFIAIATLVGSHAWAQTPTQTPAQTLPDQARALLGNQQSQAAIELLDAAPENQKASGEVAFLRGVAYQTQAQTLADSTARQTATRNAEAAYRQAAQSGGTLSAAAFNNLAALYASVGDDAKTRTAYQQAIDAADARSGYYALNFARYLETRDANKAIDMARIAFEKAPQSSEARDLLGSLLWRNRIDQMLAFARDLTLQGHTETSSQWAIKCLNLRNRPADERRAWLVLYARNRTRDLRYDDAATWREQLTPLLSDEMIGSGVKQLGDALSAPPNATQLSWWHDTRAIPSLKTTPRDTMRELLRTRADGLLADKDIGNDRTAERFLMAAVDMGARGPDPDSFLRLVEHYANSDAHEQLTRLMERYEGELFSEKSRAYMENDWSLIYRMHLALGMTYAHIGAWESTHQFRNPFFQLEAAQKAADRLNQQAERQGKPERIALPPAAVKQLADGYQRINRPERALQIRVDGANNLQKAKFTRESAQVLDTIAADQLQRATPATKTQIERLKSVSRQPRE